MLWPRLSPRPSLGFPALRQKLLSPTEHSRDDVSRGVTEPALPSLVCEVPEVGMKEGLGGSGDSSRSHSVNQQGPSGWPSARGGHCGSHVQCSSTAGRPPLPQTSPPRVTVSGHPGPPREPEASMELHPSAETWGAEITCVGPGLKILHRCSHQLCCDQS